MAIDPLSKIGSIERPDLATYACRSADSRGRKYPEQHDDDRPAYDRDRDRVIHCTYFRRLEYKTQVFVNHEGDDFRTRLTHSLETAQVARSIARRLRLNEELVEALALSHDLGHTPFGHSGGAKLDALMEPYGGFEHNLQSLRVVEELEHPYPDFPGLNLTFEAREGILKHSPPATQLKTSYNEAYLPGVKPALEAQIIDFADEIAYTNHDIDDGLVRGYITIEGLMSEPLWRDHYRDLEQRYPNGTVDQLQRKAISSLIGRMIIELVEHSAASIWEAGIETLGDVRQQPKLLIGMTDDFHGAALRLKKYLFDNLYRHPKVNRMGEESEMVIEYLFESYLYDPSLIPTRHHQLREDRSLERFVCDYIAGMTDRYARQEYEQLSGNTLPPATE
jgi:dGTPase